MQIKTKTAFDILNIQKKSKKPALTCAGYCILE